MGFTNEDLNTDSQHIDNIFIKNRSERVKTEISPEGKLLKVIYIITCKICGQEFQGKDRISVRRCHIAHLISEHHYIIDEFLIPFKEDIDEINKNQNQRQNKGPAIDPAS